MLWPIIHPGTTKEFESLRRNLSSRTESIPSYTQESHAQFFMNASNLQEVLASNTKPTWVRWRIVLLLMAFTFLGHMNRLSMRVAGDERLMADFCFSPKQMGMVYSAFLFAYTLCMTPGGWLIDRWGPKMALLILAVGSACFEAATGLGGLGIATTSMALGSFFVIRT